MKSALPWLASFVAVLLLFTPTYGIAPLTLIGSAPTVCAPIASVRWQPRCDWAQSALTRAIVANGRRRIGGSDHMGER
jgi:hypothetical protein